MSTWHDNQKWNPSGKDLEAAPILVYCIADGDHVMPEVLVVLG